MRSSPLRHPLAILRNIIGLTQKQLADLAECARPTVQAIELQKLHLSEKLALKIAYQTGVHVGWLLADNVETAPTCGNGRPFTKESFEMEQASLRAPAIRQGDLNAIRLEMITAVERLAASCSSAYKADQIWLWTYKVEAALEALVNQFGIDRSISEAGEACYPQMNKWRPFIQPIFDRFGDILMAAAKTKISGGKKRVRKRTAVTPARGQTGKK